MIEHESIESIDSLSFEESLLILREHSASLEKLSDQAHGHFQSFRKRMAESPSESMSEVTLQAKPILHTWLKQRGLPTSLSFQEFFAEFLKEHAKEYRLDLSNRSIALNADAASLIAYTSKEPIDLLDFMLYVPRLFE
jgi:hypothetical protein